MAVTPDLADVELNIVTVLPGTFSSSAGVAPIGTKATVTVQAYSGRWMAPGDRPAALILARAGKLPEAYRAMTQKDPEPEPGAPTQREQRLMDVIAGLPKSEDTYTEGGVPRVEAINKLLNPGEDETDAEERNTVWKRTLRTMPDPIA